jgi:hypothetical protein
MAAAVPTRLRNVGGGINWSTVALTAATAKVPDGAF